MYDGKRQLLIKNPLDRYLIDSPMLPDEEEPEDGAAFHPPARGRHLESAGNPEGELT